MTSYRRTEYIGPTPKALRCGGGDGLLFWSFLLSGHYHFPGLPFKVTRKQWTPTPRRFTDSRFFCTRRENAHLEGKETQDWWLKVPEKLDVPFDCPIEYPIFLRRLGQLRGQRCSWVSRSRKKDRGVSRSLWRLMRGSGVCKTSTRGVSFLSVYWVNWTGSIKMNNYTNYYMVIWLHKDFMCKCFI